MRKFLVVLLLATALPLRADDERAAHPRTLHDGADFHPYADKGAWQARAAYLHRQVLIAAGLWPLPQKTPLNAEIYGKVDRGDYTVEKVHFESFPGFFVTGNLYRPKGKAGPFPAALSPHGHWENGRLYEAPPEVVEQQLAGGWETDPAAARYPMQARAANLAKLGCVVFFYDMVGYADADPERFPHRATYRDLDSDLRLVSVFGLQTWDSIRALDFITSLPDVDPTRVACTGASGGATQTFALMNADDRLAAAAPVCMISAGEHQGGCVCENNSLLRVGTDNVELSAAFAPKPFVHPTATGDWTKDFLEHGFPQIKATYALFGAADNVASFRQVAEHNYNRKSREAVYNFFNQHLKLGHEGIVTEAHFEPLTPTELRVWDATHPRPANAIDAAGLKQYWVTAAARQIADLKATDAQSLAALRAVMEPALRHMLSTALPAGQGVVVTSTAPPEQREGYTAQRLLLRRAEDRRAIPAVLLRPTKLGGRAPKIYLSPNGAADFQGDKPWAASIAKVAAAQTVLLVDVFGTGELTTTKPTTMPATEFVAGYNRTALADRVHDALTAIAFLRFREHAESVDVVAAGDAGLDALFAKALAGPAVGATVVGGGGLSFAATSPDDRNYQPGGLRYGLGPLAALCAPGELRVDGCDDAVALDWLKAAYHAAGADDKLRVAK